MWEGGLKYGLLSFCPSVVNDTKRVNKGLNSREIVEGRLVKVVARMKIVRGPEKILLWKAMGATNAAG